MHPHIKHNLKLFALVFFGAVVLIGVFLYVLKLAGKSDVQTAPVSTTTEVAPKVATDVATTPVIDDQPVTIPSDWKQYKNDTLGISFLYPASYGDIKIGVTDREGSNKPLSDLSKINTDFTGTFSANTDVVFGAGSTCMLGCGPNFFDTGYKEEKRPELTKNFTSNSGSNADYEKGSNNEEDGPGNDMTFVTFPLNKPEYAAVRFIAPNSNPDFHIIMKSIKIY